MSTLDARLLKAHERDDKPALVALYTEAAECAAAIDAKAFYLTHAYVFALDIGAPEATSLQRQLKELGRI
ncbi:MAG: hypothetical protein ACU0AU_09035 [Cognatishimia activa]|uniref:Uncharacterized protein n=1 Tax=Cognatishimia activa TaxID=1715691 RepID=A0A975I6C7_9RHOB|nr:hypothetical protein [Cognatishimia activa]QTN34764.1 hypothetical protein HZ995_09615 [Cognatishimia activa]